MSNKKYRRGEFNHYRGFHYGRVRGSISAENERNWPLGRKIIKNTIETWKDMTDKMLSIDEQMGIFDLKKEKEPFKYYDFDSVGSPNVHFSQKYTNGLRIHFDMSSYDFFYIPRFTASYERKIPNGEHVLDSRYILYGFFGVQTWSSSRNRLKGVFSDSLVSRVRDRFSTILELKERREPRLLEPFISIEYHLGSGETVHVRFNDPAYCNDDSFLFTESYRRNEVPIELFGHIFPFELDEGRLYIDREYQKQVYSRLKSIILFNTDPSNN